ncbi:MAG TPA: response regulator [Allosphingosinicella sp.]|nr:response regulator [Allosphingosinicella sp.]
MFECNRTVYIVDDDRDVRASLGFMLSTAGLPTRAFAGGVEFLDALGELEPGCILLDVRMPQLDGLEVLQELTRRGIDWPVVMMTGHGEVSLAVQTMKLGAVDFIEKPFEEERLHTSLGRAFLAISDGAPPVLAAQASASAKAAAPAVAAF